MEHSPPRSRRLATYGTTSRIQPRSNNNTPVRGPPGKQNSKEVPLPNPSRKSRPLNTKNRDSRATDPQRTTAAGAAARTQPTAEDTIYDFPSSGEDQTCVVRRKRKRFGSGGNTTLHREPREPPKSPGPNTATGSRDVSHMKSRPATTSRASTVSPRTKNNTHDRSWISPRRRDESVQPSPTKSKTALTVDSLYKPRRHKPDLSVSDEGKSSRHLSAERNLSGSTGSGSASKSSSSTQRALHATAENTTPGRRRLIDSLGIRERSVEESAPGSPPDSQPFPHVARRSPVRPIDFVPPSVPLTETHGESNSQEPAASVSSQLRGSKVTYARQRSFLDELAPPSDLSTQDPLIDLEQHHQSVEGHLNHENTSRARLLALDDDNDDDGTVRSIHELRQAGGNARYRGVVESIFEDIEDVHNSASGRCNAFSRLCTKLLDPKFMRQFVECGFDKRLVDCLSNDLDVVSATLSFCAYGLSSLGGPLPYVLATAAWSKLLDTSSGLLDVTDDISVVAQAPINGLSRPVRKSLQNTVPQISSALFHEAPLLKLSPRLVALHCLNSTMLAFQAKGESPSPLPAPLLKQLVNLLLSESSSPVAHTAHSPESSQLLSLGFSILEAHTASANPQEKEYQDSLRLLSGLHGLLLKNGDADAVCQQTQTFYIRVILNVTNSNPFLCNDFAKPEMVGGLVEIVLAKFGDLTEDSLAQENNSLDTVILALGALTNLTEQSGASRTIFVDPGRTSKSYLGRLLRLFSAHVDSISKAHSVVEVHHNVAVGYLAVLLLTLCLHTAARLQIKESLHPHGLAVIISTVDEFLQYHQKIEQELSPLQAKGEPASGFLTRLQDLVSEIQQSEK